MENRKVLQVAAKEYKFLLNRGYKKKGALKFVGDHHHLTSDERNLLFRMIHSDDELSRRQNKKVAPEELRDKTISIDGYNVLIGTEVMLRGEHLLHCDDGFIRDIYGSRYKFKLTETTKKALSLILDSLQKLQPKSLNFFFDKPISNSGKLAAFVQEQLEKREILGEARAVKFPDSTVISGGEIIISSDGIIIEKSSKIFDLLSFLAEELKISFFHLEV
ncbi:MAG: DUF434 domain-containing protein [Candidatus Helarchaeota archaeon]